MFSKFKMLYVYSTRSALSYPATIKQGEVRAKKSYLVFCEGLHQVLLLDALDILFAMGVGEALSDRIILDLLPLDVLIGNLPVGFRRQLEVLLLLLIVLDVSGPVSVAIGEAHRFAKLLSVTNHCHL